MPALPAQRLKPAGHYHYLAETLRTLEGALRHGLEGGHFVPEDWAAIAQSPPEPEKLQLTLRIDEDVVKFFRLMGRGYLTQMNRVLRAFMHARLAGVVKGAEDVAYAPNTLDTYMAEVGSVLEYGFETNARIRAGEDVVARETAFAKRVARLRMLEDELGLDEDMRVASKLV